MENKFAIYKKYAILLEHVYVGSLDSIIEVGKTFRDYKIFITTQFVNLKVIGYVDKNEVVISICELEKKDDENLSLNKIPFEQTKATVEFINSLKKILEKAKNGGRKLIITGCFSGGTIAQIISKSFPGLFNECYAFNSQSGKNLHYENIQHDKDGFYITEKLSNNKTKTYVNDRIHEALYNYQNKPMTTKVIDIISKDSVKNLYSLSPRDSFGEEVFISDKLNTISEIVRSLEFYDNITDITLRDSFNLVNLLGSKTGGNVKIFSGTSSIVDMMKILEFYEFCSNYGVKQEEVTEYLLKINELTNRPISQMAIQTLNSLKDEQKFQENQNKIFDLDSTFKIDLNKYIELQSQKIITINRKKDK